MQHLEKSKFEQKERTALRFQTQHLQDLGSRHTTHVATQYFDKIHFYKTIFFGQKIAVAFQNMLKPLANCEYLGSQTLGIYRYLCNRNVQKVTISIHTGKMKIVTKIKRI